MPDRTSIWPDRRAPDSLRLQGPLDANCCLCPQAPQAGIVLRPERHCSDTDRPWVSLVAAVFGLENQTLQNPTLRIEPAAKAIASYSLSQQMSMPRENIRASPNLSRFL